MRCADPVLCYRSKNLKLFRHFSASTELFKALHNSVYSCGRCIHCRRRRSTELAMRCVLHASLYKENCFLTLTYDESLPGYHNRFDYSDIQDFKKKLRRKCEYHLDKKIQVFNVHEYGRNGKKHWHLVVFNHDFSTKFKETSLGLTLHTIRNGNNLYRSDELEALWPFGFSTIGNVTEASAMYQAQYTQKDFQYGHVNSTFKSHSKHSGIGRDFFLVHYRQILLNGFVPFCGRRAPVPRYFEKLAYRHYSHFYVPQNFFDTDERQRLFAPLPEGQANKELADLWPLYLSSKEKSLGKLAHEWDDFIEQNLFNKEKADFQKSGDNAVYDLINRVDRKEF